MTRVWLTRTVYEDSNEVEYGIYIGKKPPVFNDGDWSGEICDHCGDQALYKGVSLGGSNIYEKLGWDDSILTALFEGVEEISSSRFYPSMNTASKSKAACVEIKILRES